MENVLSPAWLLKALFTLSRSLLTCVNRSPSCLVTVLSRRFWELHAPKPSVLLYCSNLYLNKTKAQSFCSALCIVLWFSSGYAALAVLQPLGKDKKCKLKQNNPKFKSIGQGVTRTVLVTRSSMQSADYFCCLQGCSHSQRTEDSIYIGISGKTALIN